MSKINTYKQFNESIRGMMKPKSEEEIRKSLDLSNKTSNEKLIMGVKYDILWLVKESIEEGADVNYIDPKGYIPLIEASSRGYLDIVKYLVENGANVNIKSSISWTALIEASHEGYLNIVKYLVENGADVNYKSESNFNALEVARRRSHLEIVYYLKKFTRINESIRDMMKPKSEEEIRKSLDLSNKTPSEKLLLGAKNDLLWLVKQAIEEGVSVNQRYEFESTTLMKAASQGNLEIVKYLVENGADINLKDRYQATALDIAILNDRLDVVKYLVENGSDTTNALSTAKNFGFTEVSDYIEDYLTNVPKEKLRKTIGKLTTIDKLRVGSKRGIDWLVEEAIEEGVDINNFDGWALREAVIGNHPKVVKILLEAGANLHISVDFPIRVACLHGYTEIVKLLIEHGADIHAWDDEPLKHATRYGHTEIIKLLQQEDKPIKKKKVNRLKKFLGFNESVRDLMKPKSEEDLKKILDELPIDEKINKIFQFNMNHLYTEEEIKELFNNLKSSSKFNKILYKVMNKYNLISFRKTGSYEFGFKVNDNLKFYVNSDNHQRSSVISIQTNGSKSIMSFLGDISSFDDLERLINDKLPKTNESIRDLMKPKSDEDIRKSLDKLPPNEKINKLFQLKLSHLYTEEEIKILFNSITPIEKLFLGAKKNILWLVKDAIDNGVDIESQNKDSYSALVEAVFEDNLEIVKFLVENGANINLRVLHGWTTLKWASYNGNLEMVKYLIKNGADVNSKDKDGNTASMIASIMGKNNIVDYFESLNKTNESIRSLMKPKSEEEIKKSFKISSKYPNEKLLIGIKNDILWLIKQAIEEGANLNYRSDYGKTALIIASHKGNLDIVKYLIEKGTDINSYDFDGCTALMYASRFGYLDIVKCLVENGAKRHDALRIAKISGNSELLELLLRKMKID